jgi:hypothetical protein
VDVCGSRLGGYCGRVFDREFSEYSSGFDESCEVFAERVSLESVDRANPTHRVTPKVTR